VLRRLTAYIADKSRRTPFLTAAVRSESRDVGLILVAAVFPVQLVAALVCVPARDTPALTAVGLLAGSWLAIGLTELTGKPGSTTTTLGVFALAIA
jgi:uncharacterized protein